MTDAVGMTLHSLFQDNPVQQQPAMQHNQLQGPQLDVSENTQKIFEDSVDNFTNTFKEKQYELHEMIEGKSPFMNVDQIFERSDFNIQQLKKMGNLSQGDEMKLSARAMMEANMYVTQQAMKHTYKAQEVAAYTQLVHGAATKIPETFRTLTQG
jgi:hypothetical protein